MIYRFGDCELDTDRRELRRDEVVRPIEPQVFAVLAFLIENQHRVGSKDEILETVWDGRIVSDSALSSRIKAARQAIGDDGRAQALIRTVHKTGFRFVGEVDEVPADGPSGGRVAAAEAGPDPAGLPSLDMSLPEKPSIAVLPFRVLGDPSMRHVLADGLTRDIITRLGRLRWLFVTGQGSAFRFGDDTDIGEAARRLGVRYVAHGTVQLADAQVRVNAALTDAVAGGEIWAEHYDRALDDLFVIQDEIANSIVAMLETEIERAEQARALRLPIDGLDAWSAYQRGCWHIYRYTEADYEAAEALFNQAAELDPSSPRPLTGLSFVHWQRAFLSRDADREAEVAKAFDYARRGLALDPRDPQAHWTLGRSFILCQDLEQAIPELETAVDLNPSSVMALYSLSWSLLLNGENARSNTYALEAQRISPFDPMRYAVIAVQASNAGLIGNHEEAADLMDRAAQQPNAHYHIDGLAACKTEIVGRTERARVHAANLLRKRPDYTIADHLRAFYYPDPDYVTLVRGALQRLGIPD
ncbi:MAG: winged helix-turn-helix domain-containing protein [Kiloniellales bacterium]|nr:winged helix-turn-helix domain-containing protein [Kiloniellales bacterium]